MYRYSSTGPRVGYYCTGSMLPVLQFPAIILHWSTRTLSEHMYVLEYRYCNIDVYTHAWTRVVLQYCNACCVGTGAVLRSTTARIAPGTRESHRARQEEVAQVWCCKRKQRVLGKRATYRSSSSCVFSINTSHTCTLCVVFFVLFVVFVFCFVCFCSCRF